MAPIVTDSQAKLATRLAFIAAGFGVACWAPLVPYAKARCQVDDGTMGLILLLLAVGSILAMPLAANLSARFGSKPIVPSGGLGLAIILPLLSEPHHRSYSERRCSSSVLRWGRWTWR
jgi:MFS family permease